MKFCSYCGAALAGSAASFCSECGKSLTPPSEVRCPLPEIPAQPADMAERPPHPAQGIPSPHMRKSGSPPRFGSGGKLPAISQTRNKKPSGRKPTPPSRPKSDQRKRSVREYEPAPDPMDVNYDSYYEDVPTDDNGYTKERLQPELIKRIILIAAGTIAIVTLSVVVMSLL